MAVYQMGTTVEVNPGSGWSSILTKYIVDVSDELKLSGNRANALAFGDSSEVSGNVELHGATFSTIPYRMPIRVTYSRDGVSAQAFTGMVTTRRRALSGGTWQLAVVGLAERIKTTKVYSEAVYRIPVATYTTPFTVEDPSNPAYRAGLINWIFWQAGGRPWAQDYAYPAAAFYYDCDQALFAPDWSWVAGENAWEAALQLVRCAGGQIYQGADGVFRYKQPLAFADGPTVATYDESLYEDIEEDGDDEQLETKTQVPFTPRGARPVAEIINDATQRLVAAGASDVRTFEPQYPLKSLEQASPGQLDAKACIKATYLDGRSVKPADFTHSVAFAAQRITLTITNTNSGARPFIVNKIIMRGEPITPTEAGVATAGTGEIHKNVDDNQFIQTLTHAVRIADLRLVFYQTVRPLRTLRTCPYDPARIVGDVINLGCAAWWSGTVRHLIVGLRHANAGDTMDIECVPIDDLPRASQYYKIGLTDYSGQTKKLGF